MRLETPLGVEPLEHLGESIWSEVPEHPIPLAVLPFKAVVPLVS